MRKNAVQPNGPQMPKRGTRWTTKATDTHLEYVTLIALRPATVVAGTRLTVTTYVGCLSLLLPQQGSSALRNQTCRRDLLSLICRAGNWGKIGSV